MNKIVSAVLSLAFVFNPLMLVTAHAEQIRPALTSPTTLDDIKKRSADLQIKIDLESKITDLNQKIETEKATLYRTSETKNNMEKFIANGSDGYHTSFLTYAFWTASGIGAIIGGLGLWKHNMKVAGAGAAIALFSAGGAFMAQYLTVNSNGAVVTEEARTEAANNILDSIATCGDGDNTQPASKVLSLDHQQFNSTVLEMTAKNRGCKLNSQLDVQNNLTKKWQEMDSTIQGSKVRITDYESQIDLLKKQMP